MNGFVFCHQNDHRRRKKTRQGSVSKLKKADKEKTEFFFQCNAASIKLCCILNAFDFGNEFHFDEASASAN